MTGDFILLTTEDIESITFILAVYVSMFCFAGFMGARIVSFILDAIERYTVTFEVKRLIVRRNQLAREVFQLEQQRHAFKHQSLDA